MNDQAVTLHSGAVQEITSAEIDSQLIHARRHRRSMKECVKEAIDMATLTDEAAESCLYTLKRKAQGDKEVLIEGPSVRLAEILIYAWSNVRAGARVVDDDGKFVTAQGVYVDLEKNNYITFEVRRRVTTRSGHRFGDDMVAVTANAACSIALRNAVFKGIPKSIWEPIYYAAKARAVGTKDQLPVRVQKAFEYFAKSGATEEQLLKALQIESRSEVTTEHLGILIGLRNALKADEFSIDEALADDGFVRSEVIRLTGDKPEGEDCTDVGKKLESDAKAKAKKTDKAKADAKKSKPAAAGSNDGPGTDLQKDSPGGDGEARSDNGATEAGADSGDDEESDADFIKRIRDTSPISAKRKAVDENRGAIARIAETAEDAELQKHAAGLLRAFEEKKSS